MERVKGDIGVIVKIVLEIEKINKCQYMAVWFYRNYKVVRVWEGDATHNGTVDDCFLSENHEEEYYDDWWKRPEGWERPLSGITWDMYVVPHNGNIFPRGNFLIIENNCVISRYHSCDVDVAVGDKYVLLGFRYKPKKFYVDIQKQYFILYSYTDNSLVHDLEGPFSHQRGIQE